MGSSSPKWPPVLSLCVAEIYEQYFGGARRDKEKKALKKYQDFLVIGKLGCQAINQKNLKQFSSVYFPSWQGRLMGKWAEHSRAAERGCGAWSVPGITDEKFYYRKVQKRFSETYSPVCWTKSLNRLQIKSSLLRSEAITQNQPKAKEPHKKQWKPGHLLPCRTDARKISIFSAIVCHRLYIRCGKSKGCIQPYTAITWMHQWVFSWAKQTS